METSSLPALATLPAPRAAGGLATRREIWRRPLPWLQERPGSRFVVKGVLTAFGHLVERLENAAALHPRHDPFIVVLNHTTRLEALVVPAWLAWLRGGRMIPFLADWNFLLVPGLGALLRHNDPIVVNRKPARPAFLNVLRPLYNDARPVEERARIQLSALRSIGVFPEGTATRQAGQLLRGLTGAAKLSLATGTPVLPVGIRQRVADASAPVPEFAPMTLTVGAPLVPPMLETSRPRAQIHEWHAEIMGALARLSRKHWQPANPRIRHVTEAAS